MAEHCCSMHCAELHDLIEVRDQEIDRLRRSFESIRSQVNLALAPRAPARPEGVVQAVRCLASILIRCREGDPKSDWLPIIDNLACDALEHLGYIEKRQVK